jgi:hypothetical protein
MQWLRPVLVGTMVIAIAVFFYGFLRYPDAPLHACGTPAGYCGKWGKPHTADDYHGFIVWQRTLFLVWPFAMIAGFILYRNKSKS